MKKNRIKLSANFHMDEFECPCCGSFNTRPQLVAKLQVLREEFNQPLIITSGTRCIAHNKKVGGSDMSDHLTGRAVDVAVKDAVMRRQLLELALPVFPCIGVKKDCLHLSIGQPARVFTSD